MTGIECRITTIPAAGYKANSYRLTVTLGGTTLASNTFAIMSDAEIARQIIEEAFESVLAMSDKTAGVRAKREAYIAQVADFTNKILRREAIDLAHYKSNRPAAF